jgi:hypothetical protein
MLKCAFDALYPIYIPISRHPIPTPPYTVRECAFEFCPGQRDVQT